MHSSLKEVAPIYNMIVKNAGLCWLDTHYTEAAKLPLEEYWELCRMSRRNAWMRWCLNVFFTLAVMCVIAVMMDFDPGAKRRLLTITMGYGKSLAIFAPIIFGIIIGAFAVNIKWVDLEGGWIQSKWRTKNFTREIDHLLDWAFGSGNGSPTPGIMELSKLCANGAEVEGFRVPKHVKDALEKSLVHMIKNFKDQENGRDPSITKGDVNSLFALLQKFQIVLDETPQRFYKLAEKELAKEAKRPESRGRHLVEM